MASDFESALFKKALAQRAIEDQYAVFANEIGYYPRAFCQVALPVSRWPDNEYTKSSGSFHISVQTPRAMEVPWGIYPRGILAWMGSEVVRKKHLGEESRTLLLGSSLFEFMNKVSGTKTYSGGAKGNIGPFKRQALSLFASRIFYWYGDEKTADNLVFESMETVSSGSVNWTASRSGSIPSVITIGQRFWLDLVDHAVPFDDRAFAALWPSCLAIDIYVWLTYRSDGLRRQGRAGVQIPWALLKFQFGSDYKRMKDFRIRFLQALKSVATVYPDMEFSEMEQGMSFRFKRASIRSIRGIGDALTIEGTSIIIKPL